MRRMVTASVTHSFEQAWSVRAARVARAARRFGVPSVVGTDAIERSEGSWVDDASVSENEHDQVHGPAAVGLEVCQEGRVGCPLGVYKRSANQTSAPSTSDPPTQRSDRSAAVATKTKRQGSDLLICFGCVCGS